jgi:non-ribosomal peptide synthetase component F/thioesterase domain-containing protein/acyl carrier protein
MMTQEPNLIETETMSLDTLLSELRHRNVSLWLEGDRLRYRAAKDSLTPELLAQMKAQKPEIIAFLQGVATSSSSQLPPIVPIDRQGPVPLSFAQQRFWFLHQFEPNSSSNNMPVVVRFTGILDAAALERSVQAVVQRHEVLRAKFPAVAGQPTQVIAPEVTLTLPITDLQHLSEAARDQEAFRLATEEAHRPFDLENGPILRVLLLRLNPQSHLFVWNMHCMICDGASSDVFYQDLVAFYKAFSAGQPDPLDPLPIQYADFAHWQRQWLQGEVLETQLKYWKQKLSGHLPLIQLPFDRPHDVTIQTHRGDRGARMLPQSLNTALTTLSQQSGGTLFMTLLAAFQVLLHRYSRQDDMLISFASAGRGQMETERLLGFFSNTLLLRTDFTGNLTFRQLLQRVRESSLEAYAHQDLPFEKLIEEIRPESNQSLLPLFQVKFALNPPWSKGRGMASMELPDLTITSLFGYIYHGETKYDLILVMREQDEGLGMVFDYNADLFDPNTIARMLGHFQTLLEGIVANPDQLIAELPLLTAAEQTQFQGWNDTQINPPESISIPQTFAAQVERTPDAIAVEFKDEHLTYRELDERANQLAHYLQTLGVQLGDRVGLSLDRSVDRIVALLGILKAGGTYVPFEIGQSSIDLEINQVPLAYWVTHALLATQLPELSTRVICLDTVAREIAAQSQTPPPTALTADSIAYIATGTGDCPTPMGINHRGVIQLAQSLNGVTLDSTAVVLQRSPLSTGIAAWEIWSCLLKGGKLVVAPPDLVDVPALGRMIRRSQITTLWLSPRWINRLVDQQLGDLKSVRHLLTGGDVVSLPHLQKLQQQYRTCQIINVYSPSEMLPITAAYLFADLTQSFVPTPIGYPIANTQLYVLDHHLQPLPVGVTGDLYVGGNGWLPDGPNIPTDAWVTPPFTSATGLYRTDDLARYLPDGSVEKVGRSNQTITIRDFPVPVTRVETVLEQHPALRKAFVRAESMPSGDNELAAYVLPYPGQTVTPSQLSDFLKAQLPPYMVPSAFVQLETLPLTPEGRVDHLQLPPIEDNAKLTAATESAGAARDDLDLRLTQVWEAVLGVQGIGIQDNFFDLGGHSLVAVRLFAQIEATFGKQLALATLLEAPTIAQQAELIRAQGGATGQDLLVPLQRGTADTPPLFCIYGILLYHELARHLGPEQTVYGLYLQEEVDFLLAADQTGAKPVISFQQIADRYLQKIRTLQPTGPYFLAGESFGGLVAYEMAQQLHAQGEQVALLALLDTQTPDSSLKLPWYHRGFLHLRDLLEQGPTAVLAQLQQHDDEQKTFGQVRSAASSQAAEDEDRRLQFRRQAFSNYTLSPYPGKTTLFRAMETVSKFEAIAMNPTLGWGKLAVGGLVIHDVPGDHLGILQKPNVSVLASKLKHCIQAVQGKV